MCNIALILTHYCLSSDREEVCDENDSIKEVWIVEYHYYQINLDWKMHSLVIS